LYTFWLNEQQTERGVTAIELMPNIGLQDCAVRSLPLIAPRDPNEKVAVQR
jgi:hypothetical protein